jgi:hypothetical protein
MTLSHASITVRGIKYRLSPDKIKDGDLCYCDLAKEVDKCIKALEDDRMVVEFKSGMRAVLSMKNYKKAIRES